MKLIQENFIKYGLLMCGVIVACLFYMELSGQREGFDKSPVGMFMMAIAPAIVWFFGIRAKKKEQKNKLTFKEGITEGFKISLVYGLVSPFIFLAYYLFVNPAIVEYMKTAYSLPNVSNTTIILFDMLVQLVAAIIFGTVYAAVISFFLKSKSSK